MKRRGAALALVALVLAACSGGDDEAATTEAPPTSAATTSTLTATTPSTTTTVPATTTTLATVEPRTVDELLALPRPIVLAHSGGEDAYPGETMYGFAESAAAGVDMLDINVQLSFDGVLMTFHDSTLDRTTNGTGPIGDLTAAQIQELDAAYWFTPSCGACRDQPAADYVYRGVRTGEVPLPPGYAPDDFTVPTLQQVVDRFPGAPLNVEIKGEAERAVDAATALSTFISDNPQIVDRIVVSSFDDAALARFMELQPDIEVSPGLGAAAAWVLTRTPLPDGMRILQLPPEFEGTVVITPELVAASDAAGYPIWVWPNDRDLENEQAYLAFLELGVRGLNANQPAQAVAAVRTFSPG